MDVHKEHGIPRTLVDVHKYIFRGTNITVCRERAVRENPFVETVFLTVQHRTFQATQNTRQNLVQKNIATPKSKLVGLFVYIIYYTNSSSSWQYRHQNASQMIRKMKPICSDLYLNDRSKKANQTDGWESNRNKITDDKHHGLVTTHHYCHQNATIWPKTGSPFTLTYF